jgi:surface protein
MFREMSSLEKLDLTNFDTSNVTNMTNMFLNSNNLKTIYVSDKFTT